MIPFSGLRAGLHPYSRLGAPSRARRTQGGVGAVFRAFSGEGAGARGRVGAATF